MRLVDADELIEHAWRDRLDSRERIANMIEKAPTVKEINMKVPLEIMIKALEQKQKTDVLDKIREEITNIEIHGQIDQHTYFERTGGQVKNIVLDIIDKYRKSEENKE